MESLDFKKARLNYQQSKVVNVLQGLLGWTFDLYARAVHANGLNYYDQTYRNCEAMNCGVCSYKLTLMQLGEV